MAPIGPALQPQLPSTGLGNIGGAYGPANATASPVSVLKPGSSFQGAPNVQQLPTPSAPQTVPGPTQRNIGNVGLGASAPAAAAPATHPAIAQMPPQVTQALRSIPQSAWQQLANAGMIHPQLFQHATSK